MDDDFVLFMIIGFSIFGAFVACMSLCVCCGILYRKRASRATYSTPVVVTGQTYQPPGQTGVYPVALQTTHQTEISMNQNPAMNHQLPQTVPSAPNYPAQIPQTVPNYQPQMPMPYQNEPQSFNPTHQLPYPTQNSSYYPQAFPNEQRAFSNRFDDDLPPSYHKIDKS